MAGMSSFTSRAVKRTTGTTPHQYLIKFRVEGRRRCWLKLSYRLQKWACNQDLAIKVISHDSFDDSRERPHIRIVD